MNFQPEEAKLIKYYGKITKVEKVSKFKVNIEEDCKDPSQTLSLKVQCVYHFYLKQYKKLNFQSNWKKIINKSFQKCERSLKIKVWGELGDFSPKATNF